MTTLLLPDSTQYFNPVIQNKTFVYGDNFYLFLSATLMKPLKRG
jgi:hypothetical protein